MYKKSKTQYLRKTIKRYQKANKSIIKHKEFNQRKRKVFTAKERQEIIRIYGAICYLCQRKIDLMSVWHIDHVKAFSKGGTDDIENLRPTHKVCNELKSAKDINLVRLNAAWEKRIANA